MSVNAGIEVLNLFSHANIEQFRRSIASELVIDMATAAVIDNFEELTTCTVCFDIFDDGEHEPKFLSCHHTFCLKCVKVLL